MLYRLRKLRVISATTNKCCVPDLALSDILYLSSIHTLVTIAAIRLKMQLGETKKRQQEDIHNEEKMSEIQFVIINTTQYL
jgi:hypothetical protein